MALKNMDLKTKNWSHLGEEQTVKGGKEEKRKRKKNKRRRGGGRSSKKVWKLNLSMELTLGMDSIMDHMDFVWDSRNVYEFQI